MTIEPVTAAQQLVRIPSVNPMGGEATGDQFYEHALTDYLQQQFAELGVAWERQQVAPRRENIIARVDGDPLAEQGGAIVLLEVHQDTVPVDRMTIEPWCGELRDGRVYGRGACDVKGGMASMLAAFSRLAAEKPHKRPTVVMACTVDEELGTTGVKRLVELWSKPGHALLPRAPDAVIVAEPTLLDVVVAHKGSLRWRCHTTGKACHSSAPQLGENAIYRMAHVVSSLEEYAQRGMEDVEAHPRLGGPTLSVGVIRGGFSVNAVPDSCTIEIDRRLLPTEDPGVVYQQIMDFVAQRAGSEGVEHDEPFSISRGLPDAANGPLADALSNVVQSHGHAGRQMGEPYGTDAPAIARSGAPTVVFGPGSMEQAHTADEWIAVDQLQYAAEILYDFCRRDFGA